jgi:hypothetical protein
MKKTTTKTGLTTIPFIGLKLFALAFIAPILLAQPLQREWVRTYSTVAGKTNQPTALALSPDGNVVVAGTSQNSDGDADYQVIKYRPNGAEAWRARYASQESGQDILRGMAIDPAGNVFVTGTSGTIKYNSVGGVVWITPINGRAVAADSKYVYVTGLSDRDIVTVQLENNSVDGAEVWRRSFGEEVNAIDVGQVITLDTDGNVFVGGQIGFDCCNQRFGVVSYNTNGTQRVVAIAPRGQPARRVEVRSLVIQPDGSFAVYGAYENDSPVFDKFSATGTFEWAQNALTMSATVATKMIRDRVTGSFLAAGLGSRAEGGNVAFVGAMTADRTYHRIWEGSSVSTGPTTANDLAQDSHGNIYVAGVENKFTSQPLFLAKLKNSGEQIGLDVYSHPNTVNTFSTTIIVDTNDNVYVTGYAVDNVGGSEWVTIKYSGDPKIEKKPSGAIHLEFHTLPGRQYSIEATTNFLNWDNLITANADANGIVQYDDTNAPTIPYRFYRGSYFP